MCVMVPFYSVLEYYLRAPTHHCPYQLDVMTKMQLLRNDRFPLCFKVYLPSAGLSFIEISFWFFWLLYLTEALI